MEYLSTAAAATGAVFLFLLWKISYSCYILPSLTLRKLRNNGFRGPAPSFPFGNVIEMRKIKDNNTTPSVGGGVITHDIHSQALPHFALWQKLHGKLFIYWFGTEPFLYIADPEFLKKMSAGVLGKTWGKPAVFRKDRDPIFGNGLVMSEGEYWARHRLLLTPAFTATNLKGMKSFMVESATKMAERWAEMIKSDCSREIDVENEMTTTAAEIIGNAGFGVTHEDRQKLFEKLRAAQTTLFKSTRFIGVPFGNLLSPRKVMEGKKLGKEIDAILIDVIEERRRSSVNPQQKFNLLSRLLAGGSETELSSRELVDECKTFFFGGHETTGLSLAWTLLLLAIHPEWQAELREEIKDVMGDDGEIDANKLPELRKMGWVLSEVLRLYPVAPNVLRQAREDIQVDNIVIPRGTNMWVDIVSMHHDKEFWGEDVNEFKPQRFKEDANGGCKHKSGYLPFGFGGRICIGRNMTSMEYKIVLTTIVTKFSLSVPPSYKHSPVVMLSLRPTHGLPLLLKPLYK